MSELGQAWHDDVSPLLLKLIDQDLKPEAYGETMLELGEVLGRAFVEKEDVKGRSVLAVSTVEDADFLAKGFARHLMRSGAEVYFACLWVERSSIELDESHDIARILAEFIEPFPGRVDHFVALKSIISGSCVVRSAMLRLLDQADPQSIHVAAPLVLEGAQDRLRRGFPPEIAERFRYWVLAEDKIKDTIGNVQPGIGGNVYERLGFVDQATKNRMMPAFVIERMTARQSREPRPRMT